MFTQIINEITKAETIIIHRHKSPDGDALGSQLGLKFLLNQNFPNKNVYCVGDAAGRFSFMDQSVMDEITDDYYKGSLAIILDSATEALVSDTRYTLASKTIRMDHHPKCAEFCDIELVESSFESCAGLVAYMAKTANWSLNKLAAKSLYTGMVTDSGRFLYDSTTSRTFEVASFLLTADFDVTEIYNNLYVDDFKMVKARANHILRIKFTPNKVAYVYTSIEDLIAMGSDALDSFSISRGMVNTMANIRGTSIWVNFTETENEVLCELRSSNKAVNTIASKYGGGGHAKAAGAGVKNKEEAMRMLADLDKLAGEE